MPRLRQVSRADAEAPIVRSMYKRLFGDRDPVAEPGTATGTPGDWWTVFANSPDVLEHATRGFALYASPERKVSAVLRELGQTRAGWLVGSQFVFSQHCKACRAHGFSEEKIEALKAWSISDFFSPLERALLAYTDALVQGFGRVDDAVFDALREHLSDEAILEFTYITMMYTMHAVISVALRLEYDDRADPIVEIAAPADYAGDLGRDIAHDDDRERELNDVSTTADAVGATHAYARVRAAIVENRYAPGQRLVEQRIAEELGLSRTPVREALRMLEAEGLVMSERNRGAMVRPLSATEVVDLYGLRIRLESYAVEVATERATEAELGELVAAADAFADVRRAVDVDSVEGVRQLHDANRRFHDGFLTAARHHRLAAMLARTVDTPLVFQAFTTFGAAEIERSDTFHHLIVAAICRRDAHRAAALMAEHIAQGRDAVLDAMACRNTGVTRQ